MRTQLLILLLVAGSAAPVHTQNITCRENLDSLNARIAQNYAGLRLEITGARAAAYRDTLTHLRAAAARTESADCFDTLTALTAWFDDPHLFIFQNAEGDSVAMRRNAEAVRRSEWTEQRMRNHIARNAARLDPIEGIWYDGALLVGIVRDSAERFIAVVLRPDTTTWDVGDVRGTFTKTSPSVYHADILTQRFGRRVHRATIHRNVLLRLAPGMWGRQQPVLAADSGSLHPVDPRRPTFRVVNGQPVFAIPSHDPQYAAVIDSLVRANASLLASASRLVIDLRGNEGGSAWITAPLNPYLASVPRRSTPYDDGVAVMLSSPDQIRYARRGFGSDTTAFVRSLVSRLEASPGELVPLTDPSAQQAPAAADSVIRGPTAVGVLIDHGTVSAAEVLVLRALRSTRATVFGEPTAGALDYQSTNIVRIHPAENRWFLGYPTITRSADLPQNGMRGVGIAPDVTVDWTSVPDPIRYVLQRLP